MIKYKLFWKGFFIGEILINEKSEYIYKEDKEEKDKAIKAGMLSYVLPKEQVEWGDKISFFEERIDEDLIVTKFHTDEFRLQKI